jgi:hypothetical protein
VQTAEGPDEGVISQKLGTRHAGETKRKMEWLQKRAIRDE